MNNSDFKANKLGKLDQTFSLINNFTKYRPYTIHQYAAWYRAYINSFRPTSLFLQVQNTQTAKPVGILPLQILTYRGTRFWNKRLLLPLAHGPSDFVTLLVKNSHEHEFAVAIARWLWQNRHSWERLNLPYIPVSSAGWQVLLKMLEEYGFRANLDLNHFFLEVNTTQPWDDYLNNFFIPRNADLLKDIRKLERMGSYPGLEVIQTGIEQYLPKLMPMYDQRRKTMGQNNYFEHEDPYHFFLDVLQEYEALGLVELSMLVGNNRDVWAYQLDWLNQGTRYHYMHAYNHDYRKYSPGKLLLFEILKQSFADPNIKKCNFMRGEADYKNKFSDTRVGYANIEVENPFSYRSRITQLASGVTRLRDKIKFLVRD